VEILRFGPGHRRAGGPAGSRGLSDRVIWSDEGAHVTELAFGRRALVAPQTSPDLALFIVVSGGGWVQVGEERAAINHGEAIVWPPGVAHGAWTDGTEMRVILVELPQPAGAADQVPGADGGAHADEGRAARGSLAPREIRPEDHDRSTGEPW
jgi:quercetin dioxygenase-like cupin family protein